jgi:hypothetical protein
VGVGKTRTYIHNNAFFTHDLSKSAAGRDSLATGTRDVHDVKDLAHVGPSDPYMPGKVFTLVDDDVYRDSLAGIAGANAVIITPSYNKCAGRGADSAWWYTADAKGNVSITERVASVNGAVYPLQRPWNYTANDFVYIAHSSGDAFTTYNVIIKYQPGTHHMWVWLARNTTTWLSKEVCDMMKDLVGCTELRAVELRKATNAICVTPAHAMAKLPTATEEQRELKETVARLFGGPNPRSFIVGLFGTDGDPVFSIKFADSEGHGSSVEITENEYREFCLMGNSGKSRGFGVSEVKRTMLYMGNWRKGSVEPILVGYFLIPIDYRPRPNIMYVRQDGSVDDDVDGRASAVWAAPNPTGSHAGVADTTSDQAHIAYKEKRLEKFANLNNPGDDFKHTVEMVLDKFITQISVQSGVKLKSATLPSAKLIYDTRTGAVQAARLEGFLHNNAVPTSARSNLKSEVAAKASVAPRCITQYPEGLSIQTGRLGRMIKEVLKGCDFYTPGKPPTDISLAIRSLSEFALWKCDLDEEASRDVTGLHDTDYTKMDETISEYIYGWFTTFVLAFVSDGDRVEVEQILEANVDLKTVLKTTMIKTGHKNNSGSGVTTELNTFVSAFVEYLSTTFAIVRHITRSGQKDSLPFEKFTRTAVRRNLERYLKSLPLEWVCSRIYECDYREVEKSIAAGKSLASILDIFTIAYRTIGPKFGDDGVAPHLPYITDENWSESSNYVTNIIGMILKVTYTSLESGTFFLGRRYPAPTKTLASYADVIKAMAKLSIARNSDFDKYVLKLRGYWTTDSKTPGIGEYLTAVARIYGVELTMFDGMTEVDENGTEVLTEEMAALLTSDRDMFHRVVNGPYDVEDSDIPILLDSVSIELGFGCSSDCQEWLKGLSECSTWEELDRWLLPGVSFDPDAEPEGTRRVSGAFHYLLRLKDEAAFTDRYAQELRVLSHLEERECEIDELVSSAELALDYLLRERKGLVQRAYAEQDTYSDRRLVSRTSQDPGASSASDAARAQA